MRKKIYKSLYDNIGEYVSGEKLSEKLSISRAAVSKHISALKSDGAVIESVSHKGHKLIKNPDRMKKEYVLPLLKNIEYISDYMWYESIDSTNEALKQIGDKADEIVICTCEDQPKGKGRRGREWLSNKHNGIYTSFLLKPHIAISDAFKITCIAAIALVRTIEDFTGLNAKIKWPNDILISNKKISGTLTELSADFDGVNFIICGIGININQSKESFTGKIKDIATSLRIEYGKKIDRLELFSKIIDEFIGLYNVFKDEGLTNLIEEYKRYNLVIGKEAIIINGNIKSKGIVDDIDDSGAVILNMEGDKVRFVAGEVSLRGVNGYV